MLSTKNKILILYELNQLRQVVTNLKLVTEHKLMTTSQSYNKHHSILGNIHNFNLQLLFK